MPLGTRNDARKLLSSRTSQTYHRMGRGLSGTTSPRQWAWLSGDELPAAYLGPAGESAALGMPPFGRGVELLCNAVAGTEWNAVRWDASLGVAVKRPTQPSILTRPDPSSTPWHYRFGAVMDLVLYGNTFGLCGATDWVTRRPGWVVPVAADRVGWVEDPNTRRVWYTLDGELVEPYDPDPGDPGEGSAAPLPDYTGQLLHISAGNRSGELFGLGTLAQYGLWLGGAAAAEDYAGSYFAGGTLPPAVLQSPTTLTQPQADDLKAKWRAMQANREPVVLPTGYVLTPVVSNAVDAQLVESRTWNASEVAMLLGIPSYKLGLPGASMTYQNIESADIEFVRDSVDRYAGPLAAAFSQWLMPSGTSVQWDYAHRMRADQKSTMEVVNGYVASKVLTVDEARAMLGRPPLDTTDDANTTPAGVPELATEDVAATTPDTAATDTTEDVTA